MGPPSYMRSVANLNVVMRRIPVLRLPELLFATQPAPTGSKQYTRQYHQLAAPHIAFPINTSCNGKGQADYVTKAARNLCNCTTIHREEIKRDSGFIRSV